MLSIIDRGVVRAEALVTKDPSDSTGKTYLYDRDSWDAACRASPDAHLQPKRRHSFKRPADASDLSLSIAPYPRRKVQASASASGVGLPRASSDASRGAAAAAALTGLRPAPGTLAHQAPRAKDLVAPRSASGAGCGAEPGSSPSACAEVPQKRQRAALASVSNELGIFLRELGMHKLSVVDCGGRGDCFFLCAARLLRTLEEHAANHARTIATALGVEHLHVLAVGMVGALRRAVANGVVNMDDEQFLNLIVGMVGNERLKSVNRFAWLDLWSPISVLRRNGLHCLCDANSVEAVLSHRAFCFKSLICLDVLFPM